MLYIYIFSYLITALIINNQHIFTILKKYLKKEVFKQMEKDKFTMFLANLDNEGMKSYAYQTH